MSLFWTTIPGAQPGLPTFPVWPPPSGGQPVVKLEDGPKKASANLSKITTSTLS
jgi:hypothetical protein